MRPENIVKQRLKKDCGVAALAMATNVSYETALAALPLAARIDIKNGKGLFHYNQLDGLDKLGFYRNFNRPVNVEIGSTPAILSVPSGTKRSDGLHSIYWDGKNVYDPSPSNKYNNNEIALAACIFFIKIKRLP